MSPIRLALFATAVALLAACQNPPIHNVEKVEFATPPSVSLDDVQRAILLAGARRGWDMTPVAPGRLMATHSRSGHTATVDIAFDTHQYSIQYVSSALLQSKDDGTIHPTYNRWIQFLQNDIDNNLRALGMSEVPTPSGDEPAPFEPTPLEPTPDAVAPEPGIVPPEPVAEPSPESAPLRL
jgi:hypothetical protein